MSINEQGKVPVPQDDRHRVLNKWKGFCRESFAELRYASVDEFVEDIRGR